MATINAVSSSLAAGVEKHLWETLTENDTAASVFPMGLGPVAMSAQVIGTFGSATVVFQGSNDGTNWIDLSDSTGTAISLTAAGGAELSSAYAYFRPSASGGTSQDIDIHLVVRGGA